ncbi:MAG: hypothetical protein WA110_05770 [Anaerolineaceae bacterium]
MTDPQAVKPKPGFLSRLLDIFFVVTACSGLLRMVGALGQKSLLVKFGLAEWLPWYLFGAGLAVAAVNLAAFIFFKTRSAHRVSFAWAAVAGSILLYWVERLFMWSPDQQSGNTFFMIGYHSLCLCVLVAYTVTERKKRSN